MTPEQRERQFFETYVEPAFNELWRKVFSGERLAPFEREFLRTVRIEVSPGRSSPPSASADPSD